VPTAGFETQAGPGRSCPASYRYDMQALGRAPSLTVDSLWVAGGLYGNPLALAALLDAYDGDAGPKALVFNGDFHWFDVDTEDFAQINRAVLSFRATRGNVETELATPTADAGCGCGYPDWVSNETVEQSNRIMERLRATAQSLSHVLPELAALPMQMLVNVGDERVAIVHGDDSSLAGWGFSQEALSTTQGLAAASEAFERTGVQVFASSHTCLPVLKRLSKGRTVVNNGAAGMPNFSGQRYGLATRIARSPWRDALYGARSGNLFIEAVAVSYDAASWERRFLAQWPPGSDAYRSYYTRIVSGPNYAIGQALPPTPC